MPQEGARRQVAKRVIVPIVMLIVAAIVVVVSVPPHHSGGSDAGITAKGAAIVQRRNLIATDTESGTLSYAGAQTVYNRLSGTITWVPQIGQIIHGGQALFRVDGAPVLLMSGSTPAYRTLTSTDGTGFDIYELNRNLVALGYNPDDIIVDDTWQYATTAGVEALQKQSGETETGTLTLGEVVFLPGPQLVQTVDTTVGSTGGSASASYKPPAIVADSEFADYSNDESGGTTTGTTETGTVATGTDTTDTGTTGTVKTTTGSGTDTSASTPPTRKGKDTSGDLSQKTIQQLIQLVRAQQQELKLEQKLNKAELSTASSKGTASAQPSTTGSKASTSDASASGNSGNAGGGSAVAVLGTSSTKLVVTVDLGASVQSEARIGEKVSVEMPNGSIQNAKITAVSPVAQSSDSSSDSGGGGDGTGGSGTSSTVPVTVTLDKPAKGGGLDQASVSVNFVQSKARNVLSVPVTALLATSGNQFAVQEASSPHKLIPVTSGLFAAGYVEISGPEVDAGLKVTDSQG